MTKFEFKEVVRLEPETWAGGPFSPDNPPGTLFLFGPWGQTGGLLKLSRNLFVTLNQSEAYGVSPFQWPGSQLFVSLADDKLTVI
jgi:hypothetical protein